MLLRVFVDNGNAIEEKFLILRLKIKQGENSDCEI